MSYYGYTAVPNTAWSTALGQVGSIFANLVAQLPAAQQQDLQLQNIKDDRATVDKMWETGKTVSLKTLQDAGVPDADMVNDRLWIAGGLKSETPVEKAARIREIATKAGEVADKYRPQSQYQKASAELTRPIAPVTVTESAGGPAPGTALAQQIQSQPQSRAPMQKEPVLAGSMMRTGRGAMPITETVDTSGMTPSAGKPSQPVAPKNLFPEVSFPSETVQPSDTKPTIGPEQLAAVAAKYHLTPEQTRALGESVGAQSWQNQRRLAGMAATEGATDYRGAVGAYYGASGGETMPPEVQATLPLSEEQAADLSYKEAHTDLLRAQTRGAGAKGMREHQQEHLTYLRGLYKDDRTDLQHAQERLAKIDSQLQPLEYKEAKAEVAEARKQVEKTAAMVDKLNKSLGYDIPEETRKPPSEQAQTIGSQIETYSKGDLAEQVRFLQTIAQNANKIMTAQDIMAALQAGNSVAEVVQAIWNVPSRGTAAPQGRTSAAMSGGPRGFTPSGASSVPSAGFVGSEKPPTHQVGSDFTWVSQ